MPTPKRFLVAALALLASGCFASRTIGDDASIDGLSDDAAIDSGLIDAGLTGCETSADCDDGLFCNGPERCVLEWPVRHCVPAERHPCSTLCDEVDERCCPDEDGDGHTAIGCSVGGDCDDHDPDIYPGTPVETCGGGDDDCDPTTFGVDGDADGDGHARTDCCQAIAGVEVCGDDCDDTDARAHPGLRELCDTYDDDCDGAIDEGLPPAELPGSADCDRDGYGDPSVATLVCAADGRGPRACPHGRWAYAPVPDCDDHDPNVLPNANDWCDGRDDDCDGVIDGDEADLSCANAAATSSECVSGRCVDLVCAAGFFRCAGIDFCAPRACG